MIIDVMCDVCVKIALNNTPLPPICILAIILVQKRSKNALKTPPIAPTIVGSCDFVVFLMIFVAWIFVEIIGP